MSVRVLVEKQKNRRLFERKGQTLVEVILILPLMLLLVGAVVDWGLLFFVSHVTQNAVREGARVAVTKTSMTKASIIAEVDNKIPDTPLFSDFRNSVDVLCPTPGSPFSPAFITVVTNGNFNFMFMRLIGFTTTNISRSATMRYEREIGTCPSIT